MSYYKPKVKAPNPKEIEKVVSVLQKNRLNTVCEAALCPNRAECYANRSATFMILGDTCTRACKFCNVKTGKGESVDINEPDRLAQAIYELELDYVVITSVDRDDLSDYGAKHFKVCTEAIKRKNPITKVELLTPDFKFDLKSLELIVATDAYKLAHNQETVRRLSKSIRPQSNYDRSLKVLNFYAKHSKKIIKSSLMVGLGESIVELKETMQELLDVGVSELTIGQYLQPSPKHYPVKRYYPQSFFDEMKEEAYCMGFKSVASGVLVRSSYNASKM